ncbi:FAD-dependent oxidoreductase [Ascidiaceihabitans sp.]|uniref:NAD(P)/FAD-dependent oxidoreductase n=1 Tax=Ascidiaceihabitans sp. TaxID=1872644 RepID=UPI003297D6D2
MVGGDALRQLEPALSPAFKAAVLIKGQARAVSPGRIGTALAQKALDQGAEVLRTDVSGLTRQADGTWGLATSSGAVQTKNLVIAAWVWSAALLKPLGLDVPLVAERGYTVEFPNAATSINNSVMDVDAKIVASSMSDGVRVAGSSEFGAFDAPANPRKKALLQTQAKAMFPDLDTEGTVFRMGRRPSFPDSLPVLGSVDGAQGLFTAFGHSHYGLMMAPNTDLSSFSQQRF